MRGISPVIATVLLLLMAVAAVGGAWVWYTRMENIAKTGGQSQVSAIKEGTSVEYLFVDRAYNSGGKLALDIGNQGSDTVKVTNVTVDYGSGYVPCGEEAKDVPAGEIETFNCTSINYTDVGSGTSIKVKLYHKATPAPATAIVE